MIEVRAATSADLEAINAIYNHYVTNTAITFDVDPKTLDDRRAWFGQFADTGPHRLLVGGANGRTVGYAYSGVFRRKPAYGSSVETSIYMDPDFTGRGHGRALYGALFEILADSGLHRAYAGIALPNDASIALHLGLDFEIVGVMRECGYKFDRYWDVQWMEKPLDRPQKQ